MASARPSRITPPAIGVVRFADSSDAPYVMQLCNDSMKKTFRIDSDHDIVYLIENSVLAIIQLNITGAAIGFLSLREYPLIPSVHPTAWEDYIWTRYKTIDMNARNTLFIHLLCWDSLYSREVVDNMLKSVFMHDPYVHNIGMVKTVLSCPQLVPGTSRAEASFRRVQAIERGMPGDQLPALLIAERKEVSPRLRVRRAVEEDNDDIIPIIEQHSLRLREMYGDFYISELIARHPESERVLLVCEHKEVAVGIMCLNTQINFEALEDSYDLSPFAGLRHIDNSPYKKESKELDDASLLLSDSHIDYCIDDSTSTMHNMGQNAQKRSMDVVRVKEEETNGLGEGEKSTEWGDGKSLMALLDLFDDEEEEPEFDIINIDLHLLILPDYIQEGEDIEKNLLPRHLKDSTDDVSGTKRDRKKTISQSGNLYKDNVWHYSGPSNAFLLEMFAMHQDYDERYGFDMLEAAYELFPGKEYCVLCLPSNQSSFPLLEHFTLVSPRSTRMRFINESLYIAHINSVRGDVRVRPGEECDVSSVWEILEHAPRREVITELFQNALTSHSLDAYMLLAQRQPIGVIVVGPLEDGMTIRTQYDLEPESRRPGTDGTILGGVMSPVMEPHSRWYLREIMRHSRYTTLFWICQPFARGELGPAKNLMSLAERMVPVRPRRSLPNITGDKDLDRIYRELPSPFALWVIERPLSSYPKAYINNGIVVVGASRTGLAFLETLIMGQSAKYLTFTNVTLVSEHGLSTVSDCLKAADTCIPHEGRYTDHYLKSVPFCFYLDVMSAVMVAIDRTKKCIHFKNGGVKYYDQLVLTCGQQFQHPDYLKEPLEHVRVVQKGLPCTRMLMDNPDYKPDRLPPPPELPINVFLINTLFQANASLRRLLRMMSHNS